MPAVDSKGLTASKVNKNDEWYTRFEDIAAELPRYKEQMRGMRVICPCDWDESLDEAIVHASEEYVAGHDLFSPGGSVKVIDADATDMMVMADINAVKCNFVKFLISHAEDYGIEAVAVSGYNPATGEGVRFQDVDYSKYDLVVTNPPFSYFREFIDTMFDNDMEFLVIGPLLGAKYKNVFPRIRDNLMWPGYNLKAGSRKGNSLYFNVGDDYDGAVEVRDDGKRYAAIAAWWYTNLDVSYRHDRMILVEEYEPDKYPHYTNFDGIDVDKSRLIPCDWPGMMGVPTSFLSMYNPEQFEIIGLGEGDLAKEIGIGANERGRSDLEVAKPDGTKRRPSARIVIRNRQPEEPRNAP